MSSWIEPTDLRTVDPRTAPQLAEEAERARQVITGRLGDSGRDVLSMLALEDAS